jgi:hypothetical protein
MNNEQQQIIDGAYENYVKKTNKDFIKSDITLPPSYYPIDKEEFINKCKTDPEFSERWGLKIEERELTWDERHELAETKYQIDDVDDVLDKEGIPTKLITITYNDKTIESYE